MRFAFLTLIVVLMALPALAADNGVVHCGVPDDVNVETDPGFEICDIYSRQLAYKPKRNALRKQMLERQKNFAAPALAAKAIYKENVEAMHEEERIAEEEAKEAAMEAEMAADMEDDAEDFGPDLPDGLE